MDRQLQMQKNLAKLLHELPPGEFNLQRMTLDQAANFLQVKHHFLWLYESFDAYFNGRGQRESDNVPKQVLLIRDRYLAFYNVIQWGWSSIKKEHELMEVELPFNGPGDALLKTITLDAQGLLAVLHTSYYRFSPNECRDLASLDRKIQASKALNQPMHKQEVLLKRFKSKLSSLHFRFMWIEKRLISICQETPKADNEQLHKYLKNYDLAMSALDRYVQSELHQTKGRKTAIYRNGRIEL